jgi:hypothetical protein
MSIKKAISLSFLLFANVMMLAHGAIPHHHYEQAEVCFFDSHRKDCKEEHNHEHEKNLKFNTCCIDNVYTRDHSNAKTPCRLHKKCSCEQVLYALPLNAALSAQDFVDETITHFRQNSYVLLFYSEFISQSMGLRAPPSC